MTVENVVMSNTKGHAPACGLDIEFDHNTAVTKNVTFRNMSLINNSNCGISISPSAMVSDSARGNYDHPNRLELMFENIFVDNRGQGVKCGDDMAGVTITNMPPALKGYINFDGLQIIGGNSPALLSWAGSSDGVATTIRNARFEQCSQGGLYCALCFQAAIHCWSGLCCCIFTESMMRRAAKTERKI